MKGMVAMGATSRAKWTDHARNQSRWPVATRQLFFLSDLVALTSKPVWATIFAVLTPLNIMNVAMAVWSCFNAFISRSLGFVIAVLKMVILGLSLFVLVLDDQKVYTTSIEELYCLRQDILSCQSTGMENWTYLILRQPKHS